jgi:hypothetical protein
MKKEYGVLTFRVLSGERREIVVIGPHIDEKLHHRITAFAFHIIGTKEEFPSDFRESIEIFLEEEGYKVPDLQYYQTIKVW